MRKVVVYILAPTDTIGKRVAVKDLRAPGRARHFSWNYALNFENNLRGAVMDCYPGATITKTNERDGSRRIFYVED